MLSPVSTQGRLNGLEQPALRKCAECGESSVGVFCKIDYLILLSEYGIDKETIRGVYKLMHS